MWVTLAITGRPASRNLALSSAAPACCASRSVARCLEVADAGERAGDQHRRQRGGEDEARRIAADAVDDRRVGGDIAAHHAERLAQRALDDRHPVGDPVALRNAAAARAVHADRMDLVEIGQRAVAVGEVADRGDRGDVAVHRIDAFERDQLGRLGVLVARAIARDGRGRCGGTRASRSPRCGCRRSSRRGSIRRRRSRSRGAICRASTAPPRSRRSREVNSSAPSLPWRSASSASRST